MCKCVATGYVSESKLDEVLNRHVSNCVSIADSEPILDEGVTVSCSY